MRDRNGVDLDGRRQWEELGGVEEGKTRNQDILYEKKLFSIKEKN